MKNCPKCNIIHNKKGIFCSRHCANSRKWSENHKKLLSDIAKNNPKGVALTKLGGLSVKGKSRIEKITISCPICNTTFTKRKTENKRYCSLSCAPIGGIKYGSGRGKHGWYKNYYLDSTYELAYLIYCINHAIAIIRNKKSFIYKDENNKIRKYFPDFFLPKDNCYIEIKGYIPKDDILIRKTQSVDKNIIILTKKELNIEIFPYVERITGLKIKDLYMLYE